MKLEYEGCGLEWESWKLLEFVVDVVEFECLWGDCVVLEWLREEVVWLKMLVVEMWLLLV